MFDLNKFKQLESERSKFVDRATFVERTYYRKGKVVAVVKGNYVHIPDDSEVKDCDGLTAAALAANFPVVEVDEHLDEFRIARASAQKNVSDMWELFWDEFFKAEQVVLTDKKLKAFKSTVAELADVKTVEEYYRAASDLIVLVK
jgi:hypothetical protein